jgi:hypothetical protein
MKNTKNNLWITVISLLCLCAGSKSFAQTVSGPHAIKNVQTGMLLRIKDANVANGTPLVSYNPVNWKCMTWDFKQVEGHTYQLDNLFSHKTFQPKQAAAEGVLMEEQPLLPNDSNQLYEFIPAGNDSYLIRLKGTDLYLTPSDSRGTINGVIMLAKKNGGALQQWALYEQHPTM